jgi:hypothetical protein
VANGAATGRTGTDVTEKPRPSGRRGRLVAEPGRRVDVDGTTGTVGLPAGTQLRINWTFAGSAVGPAGERLLTAGAGSGW